jgi:hypothetical protein
MVTVNPNLPFFLKGESLTIITPSSVRLIDGIKVNTFQIFKEVIP